MSTKNRPLIIVGVVLIIFFLLIVVAYNNLVKKDEKVKLQWSEVQNTYQRRIDLIPNLVNVVKGGAEFEQNTLRMVTEARAKAISTNASAILSAESFNKQNASQNDLASAASRLIVSVEKYPDIKGTRQFSDLQQQLVGTERRIKFARRDFNEAIADYNSSVKSFPLNIIAGILGFVPRVGFQSDEGAAESVEIIF